MAATQSRSLAAGFQGRMPTGGKQLKRILVVDDDPDLCTVLNDLLSAEYSVTTLQTGLDALWELQRQPYDLVLLDIWMPRLNGLELLAELRSRQIPVKVIIMTGDNTPELVLRAVREQAFHYLTKPFKPQELLELVRGALAAAPEPAPIEVLSARRDWVELLVPCDLTVANRLQSFLEQLETDLSPDVRQSVGEAFREILLNAIEWGGKLEPNRKVRIAYLRAKRMLLYRIADPGPGFRFADLNHAALANPPDQPFQHAAARAAKGLRDGGFGILLARAKVDELLYNEAQNEVVLVKYLDEPRT